MTTESPTPVPAPAPGEPAPAPAPAPAAAAAAAAPAPAAAAPAPAAAPPVEYTDFKVPEGLTLNSEVVGDLKAFAKEKGLTQEDAQKLVDLGVRTQQATDAAVAAQIAQAKEQWAAASTADKEYGGAKFTENLAVANKAIAAFGSPELVKMLADSGLGNHPEVVRAFYRVGLAISEDKLVPGGTANKGQGPQGLYAASRMNP